MRDSALPVPTASFAAKKAKILQQLAVPDAEYTDASPKGSVDEGIRHLIDEINAARGFVTTSSCAGRVSVFLEGRRTTTTTSTTASAAAAAAAITSKPDAEEKEKNHEQVAGVGGKGAGGTWLYVSHEPDPEGGEAYLDWMKSLGLSEEANASEMLRLSGDDEGDKDRRLIHFKFEPMILHILTSSPSHAQILLRCALQAGFRESGAVSIVSPSDSQDQATPMVAIRSMGLGLESLIGYDEEEEEEEEEKEEAETNSGVRLSRRRRRRIVQPEYLRMLLRISNQRFVENTKRIERFRSAFKEEVLEPVTTIGRARKGKMSAEGGEWEDPVERRRRMRAEGLSRQMALQAEQQRAPPLQTIEHDS